MSDRGGLGPEAPLGLDGLGLQGAGCGGTRWRGCLRGRPAWGEEQHSTGQQPPCPPGCCRPLLLDYRKRPAFLAPAEHILCAQGLPAAPHACARSRGAVRGDVRKLARRLVRLLQAHCRLTCGDVSAVSADIVDTQFQREASGSTRGGDACRVDIFARRRCTGDGGYKQESRMPKRCQRSWRAQRQAPAAAPGRGGGGGWCGSYLLREPSQRGRPRLAALGTRSSQCRTQKPSSISGAAANGACNCDKGNA